MNGPMSFSTIRVIGVCGCAASTMPQIPPREVPTQRTGSPITARRWDSAVT
jgi:hypothetical protein